MSENEIPKCGICYKVLTSSNSEYTGLACIHAKGLLTLSFDLCDDCLELVLEQHGEELPE